MLVIDISIKLPILETTGQTINIEFQLVQSPPHFHLHSSLFIHLLDNLSQSVFHLE